MDDILCAEWYIFKLNSFLLDTVFLTCVVAHGFATRYTLRSAQESTQNISKTNKDDTIQSILQIEIWLHG